MTITPEQVATLAAAATPGPWRAFADETAAQVKGFPCIEADTYEVVGSEGMYGHYETDWANATFIAAAHDMAALIAEQEAKLTQAVADRDREKAYADLAAINLDRAIAARRDALEARADRIEGLEAKLEKAVAALRGWIAFANEEGMPVSLSDLEAAGLTGGKTDG